MSAIHTSVFHDLISKLTAEYDRIRATNVILSAEKEELRTKLDNSLAGIDLEEQIVRPNTGNTFSHDMPATHAEVREAADVKEDVVMQNLSANENGFAFCDEVLATLTPQEVTAGKEPVPQDSQSPGRSSMARSSRDGLSVAAYRPRRVFQQNVGHCTFERPKRAWTSNLSRVPSEQSVRYRHAFYLNEFDSSGCMVHPESKVRACWGLASAILLAFDMVFIPVDLCFEMTATDESKAMQLTSRVFWSVDILMCFTTGVFHDGRLLMDPKKVARLYLRTWFPFDVFLVTMEWLVMFIGDTSSPVSVLRAARGSRLARFLRVLRFFQFQKAKRLMRSMVVVSSKCLDAMTQSLKGTVIMLVGLHIIACLWHLLGSSVQDGWVSASGLEHASVQRKYLCSASWLLLRDTSGGPKISINTILETWINIAIYLISIIYVSGMIGLWTNTITTWSESQLSQMNLFARQFIRAHELRWEMAERILLCVSTLQSGRVSEIVANEKKLKNVLPAILQQDVNYEVRWPIVRSFDFLSQIQKYNPRCTRRMCHYALNEQIGIKKETIFKCGDACSAMYFISVGEFIYEHTLSDENDFAPITQCRPGDANVLAEAALWTHWEHCGKLIACNDSLLLNLDADKFAEVITGYSNPNSHAVKYAEHFCWKLNRVLPSDLTRFTLLPHSLDVELHIGGHEDHFAFISHAKMEAGTEATLLRDVMEQVIRDDESNPAARFRHPIFVDSENLVDLARLGNHVKGSLALIVLLTKSFLTRPWCLLEMVIARRYGRPVVPVLLDRPGASYTFPDSEFYAKLYRDEIIDGGLHGRVMLEKKGIFVAEVEESIRAMFNIIALPFTPHASVSVRRAQIDDILKRCMMETSEAMLVMEQMSLDDDD